MTNQHVQTIGYGGPEPLAIIFWYEPGEDEPSYKTICYSEDDVIAMDKRHKTPSDFYSNLRPSIQLVGDALRVQQTV